MGSVGSKHDVFVNFRGPDVRQGFLKNLQEALVQSGIKAFVDDEDVHEGQSLTPALERAIELSRVAIVVFSQDYASSEWCLNELVNIDEGPNFVVTVFYKVEPRQVRLQTGNYGVAMTEHERRHGVDSDVVKKWRDALFVVSTYPRSRHIQDDSDEAEVIRGLVEDVKAKLQDHLKSNHHNPPPPQTFGFDHFRPRSTLGDPLPSSIHDHHWHSPSVLDSTRFLPPQSMSSLSSLAMAPP